MDARKRPEYQAIRAVVADGTEPGPMPGHARPDHLVPAWHPVA
jgi:hypothetical protein